MKQETINKIKEIADLIGIDSDKIKEFDDFIDALYKYIKSQQPASVSTELELLKLVQGNSKLEEPFRSYLLFKTVSEEMYKKGFEDALRLKRKEDDKEVREKQKQLVSKVLDLFEKNVMPVMNRTFELMNRLSTNQNQQQNTQPNIKVKFEE